jgi:hypothetical protein
MCRSIQTLRRVAAPATSEEVHAGDFEEAVSEIALASQTLLDSLETATRARHASPLHLR